MQKTFYSSFLNVTIFWFLDYLNIFGKTRLSRTSPSASGNTDQHFPPFQRPTNRLIRNVIDLTSIPFFTRCYSVFCVFFQSSVSWRLQNCFIFKCRASEHGHRKYNHFMLSWQVVFHYSQCIHSSPDKKKKTPTTVFFLRCFSLFFGPIYKLRLSLTILQSNIMEMSRRHLIADFFVMREFKVFWRMRPADKCNAAGLNTHTAAM